MTWHVKHRTTMLAVSAEFVATMLFIYVGCGSVMATLEPGGVGPAGSIASISLAFGFGITALVHAFGHISGGHINPAVTFALIITRKIKLVTGILYIVAQVLGGIVGAALLYASVEGSIEGSCNVVSDNQTDGRAFVREAVLTFLLVTVVMGTLDPDRDQHSAGSVGIGLAVAVAHLTSITTTGTGINPARSFAPAVITGGDSDHPCWDSHYIFWVAPLFGGGLAGLVYQYIFDYGKTAKDSRDTFTSETAAGVSDAKQDEEKAAQAV